jgi:hypothetical protein
MVEQVTITQETNNPTLEQQAQTLDANSQAKQETQTNEISTKPEWLPEKFSSVEELAKAYKELEQKFSTKQEPKATKDLKIDNQKSSEPTNTFDKFYNEFSEKGSLSEKSYGELEKLGLNKQLVDAYIAGQQALSERENASILSSVGGEEKYKQMIDWSSKNLSEQEINTFNETLEKGTLQQVQLAVAGINARFLADTKEPNLYSGSKTASNVGYQSVAEMLADINNPKYKSDSAFRSSVEQKVKFSNVI